jgi:hypothetical protein
MIDAIAFIADVFDAEFDGKPWNGPSLMATLEKLGRERAASTGTFEGYSAWEIAIHCAKYKDIVARELGANVPEWPFSPKGNFPPPEGTDERAWQRDLRYFREAHTACSLAIRAMGAATFESEFSVWKCPWKDALAWLITHDCYHAAQIRSMGLSEFKADKQA